MLRLALRNPPLGARGGLLPDALQGPWPHEASRRCAHTCSSRSTWHAHGRACASGNPPGCLQNFGGTDPGPVRTSDDGCFLPSVLLKRNTSQAPGLVCIHVRPMYTYLYTCFSALPGTIPSLRRAAPPPLISSSFFSPEDSLHLTPRTPSPLKIPSLLVPEALIRFDEKAVLGCLAALTCSTVTPEPFRSLALWSGRRTGTEGQAGAVPPLWGEH